MVGFGVVNAPHRRNKKKAKARATKTEKRNQHSPDINSDGKTWPLFRFL